VQRKHSKKEWGIRYRLTGSNAQDELSFVVVWDLKIPKWAVVDGDDHQAGCAGTEVRRRFRGGFWWVWANDNKMEASQVTILLCVAKNYSAAALGASWIGLMQRLMALRFSQSDVRLRAVRFNIAPSRIAA